MELRLEGLEKAGNATIEVKDDLVWVGAENGLYKIDRARKQVLEKFPIEEGVFPEEESLEAAIDGDRGVLWLAAEGCVVRFDGRELRRFTAKDGLPGEESPDCIGIDERGRAWVGYSGVICGFDGARWRRVELEFKHPRFTPGADVISFDGEGGVYAADTHVLSIIKGENYEAVVLNEDFNTIDSGDSPECIYVAKDGSVWIGTWGNGVIVVKKGAIKRLASRGYERVESPRGMAEDAEGNLWLCCSRSLFKIDNKIEEYSLRGRMPGVVTDFKIDKDGDFWLLTKPGNELLVLQQEEILTPLEVREARGKFSGLPVVRVSGFEYVRQGLLADFWSTREHERMARICMKKSFLRKLWLFLGARLRRISEERLREADEEALAKLRGEVMEEMLKLGERLKEKGLERCLRAFMSIHGLAIPALADRIKYQGRDAWVFAANWGFDPRDYSHIILEVIDEETGETLFSERCR
jgi:ligand-binding sensor domain-containing protein